MHSAVTGNRSSSVRARRAEGGDESEESNYNDEDHVHVNVNVIGNELVGENVDESYNIGGAAASTVPGGAAASTVPGGATRARRGVLPFGKQLQDFEEWKRQREPEEADEKRRIMAREAMQRHSRARRNEKLVSLSALFCCSSTRSLARRCEDEGRLLAVMTVPFSKDSRVTHSWVGGAAEAVSSVCNPSPDSLRSSTGWSHTASRGVAEEWWGRRRQTPIYFRH